MLVAGIDPAAVRPSTLCLFGSLNLTLKGDLETLLRVAVGMGASVIAIDSPLQLPNGPMRDVDRKARKLGLKVLPPGWRGMRKLVERVLEALDETKVRVIETFPRGVGNYLNWIREMDNDEIDACLCAIAAWAYLRRNHFEVKAEDGVIVVTEEVLKKSVPPRKLSL
ncbi:hypothetical protein EYM_01675 [Ignicoccus islandicus DSM 13165]|uniref:DUF429 domain-containing protein n=1 Tax=Ignicoccus islandicus DSM 13165 TaxID=940295 RepID=A0A0U3E0R2_9CREN|nr:hypothetical protein [Ignicoccus islandicus]ALU11499.1 hypothetical protein EYM_01675 [Ignicoccus islandicus DSM 13165]